MIELTIDRQNIFKSTYEQLNSLPPMDLLQTSFYVTFAGEQGRDGGSINQFILN